MSSAPRPAMAGDFLVPLLRTEGGCPDPVAIETWHLALGAAVASEVPHDLFALWLFPDRAGSSRAQGAVLLGPPALAADRVDVPRPDPALQQDDLYRLEDTLRRAKYLSAMAAPISQNGRDVGVLLLGSFSRGAFGPREAIALRRLSAQLAPTMADLAGKLAAPSPRPLLHSGITRETLPEQLARSVAEAVSGPDLVSRTSGVLHGLLPHDRLEVLVPGRLPGSFVGLSGQAGRRRWSGGGGAGGTGGAPAGGAPPGADPLGSLVERFGTHPTLLVVDLLELAPDVGWEAGSHSLPIRSVLGARLPVGGATAGYVLLGSVARDVYRPEDEDVLGLAAVLLAGRVAALRGGGGGAPERASADEPPLHRAAEALAGTASLEAGLRQFAAELGRVLPHQGISILMRRGEDEVVTLDPHAPRPLGDLPGMPVSDFAGAPLLADQRDWLVVAGAGGPELLVPLQVAGRIVGVLGVRSPEFSVPREAAALVRPFANLLGPHLEPLRRGLGGGGAPVSRTSRVSTGNPGA